MSYSKKSKNSYAKIINNYKEEDYFVQSTILLKYTLYQQEAVAGNKSYVITGVELQDSNDGKNKEAIGKIVEKCNNDILNTSKEFSWQIFYALKVLLQSLTSDRLGFNYFRGQSHNHPLLPGALRYKVDSAYIKDFESTYKKLAYAFPDTINYVSMSKVRDLDERESNLSVLQHYGLKTALLDITKNPFIAMLFMLSDSILYYKEPTLYLFKINDNVSDNLSLFSEVRKSHTNERIIAQKGAFLSFEKILDNKVKKKIPFVKIVLRYDAEKYLNERNIDPKETDNKKADIENKLYEQLKSRITGDVYKEYCLKYINNELETKLKEYYYTKEDMFPDFENRIRYLSNKYSDDNPKTKKLNIDVEEE